MLKARGTYRADRARKNEVKEPGGTPRCPAGLDKPARQCWNQLIPMLMGMGVLSRIDRNAIIRYCTDLSRWKKLQQFLAKNGEVYPIRDGNGKIKCFAAFPHVSIANKLSLLLTKFEQEFGMTPSARTRIECNEEDAQSQTIEEFLKHRYFEERFMGKPSKGMSAQEAMDILEKANPKPPPELKIDWGPEGKPPRPVKQPDDGDLD